MSRKHHAIYSDPTGAAAAAAPAKRRATRAKGSESSTSEISSRDSTGAAVDREAVARLAYSYWEARGFVGGSAEEDWLRAEAEIRSGQAASATA